MTTAQHHSAVAVMLEVVLAGSLHILDREIRNACFLKSFQSAIVQRVLFISRLVNSDRRNVPRGEPAICQLPRNVFHLLTISEVVRGLVRKVDVERVGHR